MRKIVSRAYAHPFSLVKDRDVLRVLFEIIQKFELVRDWSWFILDNPPDKDTWITKKVKTWEENLLDMAISKISCTEVKKFPRYPKSAWFRNKYREED